MKGIDFSDRVDDMRKSGLCCAQVSVIAGLEIRGEENPQMVHAVRTLCTGMQCQKTCGAVTGSSIMIGLFDSPKTGSMVRELVSWFEKEYGTSECAILLQKKRTDDFYSCSNLIRGAIAKTQQLLRENNVIE